MTAIAGNSETKRKHFLISKAYTYQRPDKLVNPLGHKYDIVQGMWIREYDSPRNCFGNNGIAKLFPTTKKHDIETGEDQKGE